MENNQDKSISNIAPTPAGFRSAEAPDAAQLAALEGRSQRALKENFFRRQKKTIIAIGIVISLAVAAMVWQLLKNKNDSTATLAQSAVSVEIPEGTDNVFVNDVSGVSTSAADQADSTAGSQAAASMGSENFSLKEVTFGTGSTALYAGGAENDPLLITDVHSEVLTTNNESEVKLLITWNTNKLARATVNYDKGGAARTLTEGGYGFSHALVLANLERATRYTFNLKGTDRWGNTATSDTFNTYIGNKSASVFELISQQFSQMFGWAIKK